MLSSKLNGGVEQSFDKTIKSSELLDVSLDVADVGIDTLLSDGIIKELPIVKVVYAIITSGISIHDKLFLKKIISFLTSIKDVSPAKRQKMITAIDSSKKYRIKVGEKLLFVIDSCNDYEVAELVGVLFRAYLIQELSYDEYLLATETISNMPASEVKDFIREYDEKNEWRAIDDVSDYVHSGLYNVSYEPPRVDIRDNDDWKEVRDGGSKYIAEVDGGDMWATPSRAGRIIWATFKDFFADNR